MFRISIVWLLLLAAFGNQTVTPVSGQQDSNQPSDDFPEVYNSEAEGLEPMDAQQAVDTMQLPEGFHATVFAAEPDVRNPIAMAWDDRGRMWVAENYTYAEREQRFDLSLRDRVLIFEDRDGDGRADSRKVFFDQVQMLTSVEVGHGGVWLMCPPQLLFIPDADGDDIPDGPAQVMLDGFEVGSGSYHNFANGLRWGPDGWLYGRCGHSCPGQIGQPGTPAEQRVPIDGGIWRFHPQRRTVEVLCHGTVNPWGHDWDRHGELFFINTVIGHLWHATPGSHFKESFGESINPRVYERMDMIADHYHFDTSGSWSQSRDGKANDFGGGHAHVGMTIYQGDVWPERYRNRLLTINMHGRRVNQERLDRTLSGYVGKHDPDLLISEDPFFRGTDLSVGPDRQLYLIDWSDTGECHEHTGVHRQSGRIFRIAAQAESKTKLDFAKPLCLAGPGKLPELWRKYQSGNVADNELLELTRDEDEHVRVWAIRLLTDHWPLDWITGPPPGGDYPDRPEIRNRLVEMAETDDSGLVLRTLASTLQRMPLEHRSALAAELLQRKRYAQDEELILLTWYGLMPLADSNADSLVRLAKTNQWPRLNRFVARSLATEMVSDANQVPVLLEQAMEMVPESRRQILLGLHDALQGLPRVVQPEGWQQFAELPGVRSETGMIRELEGIFGNGRALSEIRKLALAGNVEMATRRVALRSLIDARPEDLQATCEKLLDTKPLNTIALDGLVLLDDPKVARTIIRKYRRFDPVDRPRVIETLVSRASFAKELLDAAERGTSGLTPKDISASQARQILALGEPSLREPLSRIWGEVSETSEQRAALIESWKQRLDETTLAKAELTAGRKLFNQHCSSCHRLYGQGQDIAPDLTGAQRSNLDYLLQNIIAPSAVVPKDYRMTTVQTIDGRVLNGLVVRKDAQRLVLQSATEQITIPIADIENSQQSSQSAMPEGLLTNLSEEEVRDLIGYLMHPTQVSLPE